MRWFGLLLMAAAGLGFGLYGARQLTGRVKMLQTLERLLAGVERRMTYTRQPIAALWRQLAAAEESPGVFAVRVTAGLGQLPFGEAVERAAAAAYEQGELRRPEQQILEEWGREWGRYDVEQQAAHTAHCVQRLAALEQAAGAEAAAKGKLCRVAGLTGGLAVALLLI